MERVKLPECERGNTWLIEDHRQLFLARMEPDILGPGGGEPLTYYWLQINIVPANYPGFNITTITSSEAKLAAHITKEWPGAFAKRCNINGVRLSEESTVMGTVHLSQARGLSGVLDVGSLCGDEDGEGDTDIENVTCLACRNAHHVALSDGPGDS